MFQCIVASQQNHIETNWKCEQIDETWLENKVDLSDLTFRTASNGLQHLKALAPLPCPQPLQPTCEIFFMSFHVDFVHAALNPGHTQHLSWYIKIYSYIFYCAQLVCSIVIYYDLTLPGNELKPMWKKFCNLVNAGPFLALDLLRTSHHWLLTWKKIGPRGV